MRIRLLHPDFFSDEILWSLSDFAKLVFEGLWLIADREGRLLDNVKMIDGLILPLDRRTSAGALEELAKAGRVRRYQTKDGPVLEVVNFKKYQPVHPREKPSKFQAFLMNGSAREKPRQSPGSAREKNLLGPSDPTSTSTSTSNTDPDPKRRHAAPSARAKPPISRPSTGRTQEQRRRVAAVAGAKRRASAPVDDALIKKHFG